MHRRSRLLPFLAACLGIASFSAMDAVMKGASLVAGVYTALVLRNALGTIAILPVWLTKGATLPSRASLTLHAKRSVTVAIMAPLFFWGLVRMPIAEAIALSFIAPLIALYLAAAMLGEAIRVQSILASLIGFGGVVIIVVARLGDGLAGGADGWGIAAVLTSAVFYALNLVLQRQQAQVAGPVEVALFQNLLVGLFLLPAAPWLLRGIDFSVAVQVAGAALLAVVSLLLLTWAYARAEAQVLLPVEYTGFAWAALFGWLWFDEAVTWTTIAGVALIIGACWMAARSDVRGQVQAMREAGQRNPRTDS
jgi:S-adenosylmethionine uptake transporter